MDEPPLPDVTEQFARTLAPERDEILTEMDERADREGFPTVGPAVGAWLRLRARLTDARRVFEFGSGFGYSAYWMAPALPADGEIVLTEIDADELESAREYFRRGGYADRAAFEHGDAIDVVERYDGPFDVVLIDHDKPRYADGFEKAREKIPEGGVVVADNMTRGPIDVEQLEAYFADDEPLPDDASEGTEGIANYVEHVKADPAFESFILPVGSGICLSTRVAPRE